MIGLGTLINVACIVGGGTIGLLASSLVTERLQSALLRACGVCVIFVGAAGTLQHMLVATAAADGTITLGTQGTMTMLISLALGTVAGELLDLDGATALSLDASSLVTMMELSGIADSLASYVCYALLRVADAYEARGDAALAAVRRGQATAVSGAFLCELGSVPAELRELDEDIAAQLGER